MWFLSLNVPLIFRACAWAIRMRADGGICPGLIDHCRRKRGRCPFTLAANRACLGNERMRPLSAPAASIDERAAAVFADVDAYDLVERAFGFEAEFARAARLAALRPARDDARDPRILRAANARGNALAGDAPQRRDPLGDAAAAARPPT